MTAEVDNKPVPPGDYDCCENGCSPCVWDIYYEALNEWNAQQKAKSEAPAAANQTLETGE